MNREVFYQSGDLAVYGDQLGNDYQVRGVILGDGDNELRLLLKDEYDAKNHFDVEMTPEMWDQWFKFSDDPVLLMYGDESKRVIKAIVRKCTRQVIEDVRWQVYRRDAFTCQYCGAKDRPLTFDHYLAQVYGGPWTVENGLTACRPCNKAKGHKTIAEWEKFRTERGMKGPND